jgi:hypothetical protein
LPHAKYEEPDVLESAFHDEALFENAGLDEDLLLLLASDLPRL